MTKTPIDPADIREGDLVRFELKDGDAAYEWRQRQHLRAEHRVGTYYLLDRPKPPFTPVPTEALEGLIQVASLCDATYPDYRKAIESFLATIETNA